MTSPEEIADCAPGLSARVARQVDDVCVQRGLLPGAPVLMIDSGTAAPCWCACGPQAGINMVATPAGQRPMSTLACGDAVLAAGPALVWAPAAVRFSAGALMAAHPHALIRVHLAARDGTTLSVVPDHLFLAATGGLVRAQDLAAGDALRLADGTTAAVAARDRIADYRGYVWCVATSDGEPDGLDGHLLNTGGVVSGDYALQLFFDRSACAGPARGVASASRPEARA